MPGPRAEAAAGPGDDVLATHQRCVAADALRDELRVSMKLVVESITPGMMPLPAGRLMRSNTFHVHYALAAERTRES